ncbi:hypothetical protein BS50DRAFT_635337 [Corynespora cassiicola Philippines]|uniref:Uncharacterized protein n=1 Tax=Corynespora cassiicola Philippines TaxID=1448308 RepID=A0A2T2NL74_CORCC|nr:hypothetical protein BS50DRAFT_635337 [Corynespora cassiicola Philippines]
MAVLSRQVISATGNFGHGKSNDQLRRWVDANGGQWMPKPGDGLTHLICSESDWKRKVPAVQEALKLEASIVSYDWLEDSLQKRKKLAEAKYTWEAVKKKQRTDRAIKKMSKSYDTDKFNKGAALAEEETGSGTSSRKQGFFASAIEDLEQRRKAREAEVQAKREACATQSAIEEAKPDTSSESQASTHSEPQTQPQPVLDPKAKLASPPRKKKTPPSKPSMSPPSAPEADAPEGGPKAEKLTDLYHIYLDRTGFEYNIMLLRTNLHANSSSRYNIRLYESNYKPHVYCTFARYAPPGSTEWSSTSTLPSTTPPSAPTNPEAQRLNALIAPAPEYPSQNAPWRSLLAPQNSSYATAFTAFRDAFASLTLLTWEERIDPSLRLQKARAEFFGLEPFIWIKPPLGTSFGVVPPSAALLGPQSEANALAMGIKRPDGGFEVPWLARGLPGSKVGLCKEGRMGGLVERERERRALEIAGAAREMGKGGGVVKKRANFNRPLFNGVNGRPAVEEYVVDNSPAVQGVKGVKGMMKTKFGFGK